MLCKNCYVKDRQLDVFRNWMHILINGCFATDKLLQAKECAGKTITSDISLESFIHPQHALSLLLCNYDSTNLHLKVRTVFIL